jgi:SAM-dependent methyltransferase
MSEIWRELRVADDSSHHTRADGTPAYKERFDEVLKFHAPGLAPVSRAAMAWHIDASGEPAYHQRFKRTFGFYEGAAAVIAEDGWHHIRTCGSAIYGERYAWCGNFQGSRCAVREEDGRYFHITPDGAPAYTQRWRYAGDFRDGIGVVQHKDGRSTHVDPDGNPLHGCWFLDLDVFHKGFARARDQSGWMHIDQTGHPLYDRRFASVEPFYNGQARVERADGGLEVIDESGTHIVELRPALQSEFHALSADLVGYWKTKTIGAAVSLGVFDLLPGSTEEFATGCDLPVESAERLLRGLGELGLTQRSKGVWCFTTRGRYLQSDHPLTLANAANEYAGPLLQAWNALESALRSPKKHSPSIFRDVADNASRRDGHHRMLRSYAVHDYAALVPELGLEGVEIIIDAGGGSGALSAMLAKEHPTSQVVLLDLPEVAGIASRVETFVAMGADLFSPWPVKGNAIILARVLHDWNDDDAVLLLKHARSALRPGGQLLVVEMVLDDVGFGGALCDLHLLAVTGGKERTLAGYEALFAKAGFRICEVRRSSALPVVLVGRAL